MKTLEKKELKSIKGGFEMHCTQGAFFTTKCTVYYDNGYVCKGVYGWDGTTTDLHCYQTGNI